MDAIGAPRLSDIAGPRLLEMRPARLLCSRPIDRALHQHHPDRVPRAGFSRLPATQGAATRRLARGGVRGARPVTMTDWAVWFVVMGASSSRSDAAHNLCVAAHRAGLVF